MALGRPRLHRPRFLLWNPRTWWDRFFIRAGLLSERLWANALARLLLRMLIGLFRLFVWGVSPATNFNFHRPPTWPRIILVALCGALAAYVFSYWLNYLFAFLAGTLSGADPLRRYFLDDLANIQIYTFIAPVYIGCSCAIIYIYATNASFREPSASLGVGPRFSMRLKYFAFLVVGLSAITQVFYYDQVMTHYGSASHAEKFVAGESFNDCELLTYWFAERTTAGRSLNVSGYFYFFGNLVRLAIVLAAALCFVAASASVIKLGLGIKPDGTATHDIHGVRETLFSFSLIELWTKALYLILDVHGKVWGVSCLKGDLNIRFANILLVLIGLIALTIPRNFVEYRLWRHLRALAAIDAEEGLPDLRSEQVNWFYSAIAAAFFLAIAFLFMTASIGTRNITDDLWRLWSIFARN